MDDEAPNAEIAATNQPLDVSNAAALLTRAQAPAATPDRGADGKFVAKQPDGNPLATEEPAKVVDLKTGKPPEAQAEPAAAVEPAPEEDDYFEFPEEEEGKGPRKVKLDEVLAAYEELPKLKGELENARKSAPPPADYTTALHDIVQQRSKYLEGLEVISQIIQPRDPSIEMLNSQSQHYNPDGYYAAKQRADQDRQMLANINAEKDKATKAQDEQNGILLKAAIAREKEALSNAWPEFKSNPDATMNDTGRKLIEAYGFTPQEFNSIADHRQFLVIRDALAFRALKAKEAEAVKVVRQKPKLVKGAARSTTNPQAQNVGNAMTKLATSHSTADAVQALKALKL